MLKVLLALVCSTGAAIAGPERWNSGLAAETLSWSYDATKGGSEPPPSAPPINAPEGPPTSPTTPTDTPTLHCGRLRCEVGNIVFGDIEVSVIASTRTQRCQIADILFGKITVDPLERGKAAVIRSSALNDPNKPFGALLGMLSVARAGALEVRNVKSEMVGIIYPQPERVIEGSDGACAKGGRVVIRPVQGKKNVYVILGDSTPLGTIEGRLPD